MKRKIAQYTRFEPRSCSIAAIPKSAVKTAYARTYESAPIIEGTKKPLKIAPKKKNAEIAPISSSLWPDSFSMMPALAMTRASPINIKKIPRNRGLSERAARIDSSNDFPLELNLAYCSLLLIKARFLWQNI